MCQAQTGTPAPEIHLPQSILPRTQHTDVAQQAAPAEAAAAHRALDPLAPLRVEVPRAASLLGPHQGAQKV